jgi:hypothetical protein
MNLMKIWHKIWKKRNVFVMYAAGFLIVATYLVTQFFLFSKPETEVLLNLLLLAGITITVVLLFVLIDCILTLVNKIIKHQFDITFWISAVQLFVFIISAISLLEEKILTLLICIPLIFPLSIIKEIFIIRNQHKKRHSAKHSIFLLIGYIILALLTILSTYESIFSPSQVGPRLCTFEDHRLYCVDHILVKEGQSKIILGNSFSTDINVTHFSFTSEDGEFNCRNTVSSVTIKSQENAELNLGPKTGCVDKDGLISKTLKIGHRIKGNFNIHYIDLNTTVEHEMEGKILNDLEPRFD